jgi:hypothetical protein
MPSAKLIFTSFSNSFSVHVENLESLSVEQIQELQLFVSSRKGVFDFNNYTFAIQKRIEFHEFLKLISQSGLKATCFEKQIVVSRKSQIGFGQYKGVFYEDLPDSYMLWLKTNYRGYEREAVEKELFRRAL